MTDEWTLRTRQHFIDIHRACIQEVLDGRQAVDDLDRFLAWQNGLIARMQNGDDDRSFTFQQHRHTLMTGESVPFFSKPRN